MPNTLALCDLIAEQLEMEHGTDTLALCERIVADIEARELRIQARIAASTAAHAGWQAYAALVRAGRGKAA